MKPVFDGRKCRCCCWEAATSDLNVESICAPGLECMRLQQSSSTNKIPGGRFASINSQTTLLLKYFCHRCFEMKGYERYVFMTAILICFSLFLFFLFRRMQALCLVMSCRGADYGGKRSAQPCNHHEADNQAEESRTQGQRARQPVFYRGINSL